MAKGGARSTFFDSASLEDSSICFTPLTRASMTRVDVTSFSLKKRFTTPCVEHAKFQAPILKHATGDLAAMMRLHGSELLPK